MRSIQNRQRAMRAQAAYQKRREQAASKKKADAAAKKKETARRKKVLSKADTNTVSGRIQKQMGMESFEGRGKDIVQGAQFGEAVLGPDGLGRLGDASQFQTQDDGTMAAMKAQAAELAKGFSSEEMLARKEKGIEEIQGSAAAQSRAMQAQLARSGVKGMAAGQQLGNIAMSGIEARGNLERDLMIANREAQMQGLQQLSGIHGQDIAAQQFNVGQAMSTKKFDLSQAAKEKDIALQAGLGFAQMGSTERAAELNRQAQVKAAKAGRQKSCHVAGTPVMLEDGSYKNIEDLQVGDQLAFGGALLGKAEMMLTEDLYEVNGEIVTESHLILDNNFEYIQACDYPGAKKVVTDHDMVYPLFTENGCYYTSFLNGDFSMEMKFKEERKCILDELIEKTEVSLKTGSIN